MYKHILLAVDGSDNSFRAAQDAVNIATSNTLIEIISVISTEGITSQAAHAGTLDNLEQNYRTKFAREEQFIKNNHANYKVVITHGHAGRMISKYANDNKVNLVVIGCRGLNPMHEMVFGSVSTYVTKNANCSTLLVK
ncbi:universal stress protein [Solibacillus sp. R5-41]|uniref:universal stress protein n=1 Tax=Solibacillus sp. R5-41 TaxID=2048654 RepID=UPI000C1290A4|nr:universal stress protein [Solibacillus sp. R5-41]ATP41471.1 universal stress protein [Solibacillus sp. R5-41]